MIEITTGDFNKEYDVSIDGNHISIKALGAGTMLAMEQNSRWLEVLEKRHTDGIATDEEELEIDRRQKQSLEYAYKIFTDKTKEQTFLKTWLKETPAMVINLIVEDVYNQVQQSLADEAGSDGTAQAS